MPLLVLALLLASGGVRPPPQDPLRSVVDVELVAVDPARQLVAAVLQEPQGPGRFEIHDVDVDQVLFSTAADDAAAIQEVLEAEDLRRDEGWTRIEAKEGRLALPMDEGVLEVQVVARAPLAAEFATDAAIDAWRRARQAEDRPYASTDLLVAHATVGGRILHTRRVELGPGDEAELSFPAAFVKEGKVVFAERLLVRRGESAGTLWSFSPVLDLDALLRRLAELPRDEGRILEEAPAAQAEEGERRAEVPPPDPPTEADEPSPASVCCGVPILGSLCMGIACLEICGDSWKAGKPAWNRCSQCMPGFRCGS